MKRLSAQQLTIALKAQAIQLGFVASGVAPALPLTPEGKQLRQWLAQHYHADMAWMEKKIAKRTNPKRYLPTARSVVMVALNYYQALPDRKPGQARIARYALGQDYHEVLKERVKKLAAWLQTQRPRSTVIPFVDTAAVMEKAWAQRAGVGWIGKNGLLITRSHGSFVVLGGIITNIPLHYNQPHPNHCGMCRRCLDSCPTKAIVQPQVVDARKCISYWTIESRAPQLPKRIAKKLDGRVFGCDRCQEVCPWNQKFAQETQVAAFKDRPINRNPRLDELAKLTPEKFQNRFRHSAVKRTKYSGFMRNVRTVTQQERQRGAGLL